MRSLVRLLAAFAVVLSPAFPDVLRIEFTASVLSGQFSITESGSSTDFPIAPGTPLTGSIFIDLDTAPAPVSSTFDSGSGPVLLTDLNAPTPIEWLHVAINFGLPALPLQNPPIPFSTSPLPAPPSQPASQGAVATQQINFAFISNRTACCDTVVLTDSVAQLLSDGETQISYTTQAGLILASLTGFLPAPGVPTSFAMENGLSNGFFEHRRTTILPDGERNRIDARVDYRITEAAATTVPEPSTGFAGLAAAGLLAVYRRRRAISRLLS